MVILRASEIRKMVKDKKYEDLDKKISDLKKELLRMRTQISQGTAPDKPGRVRQIRRTIARIKTIKNE